MPTNSKFDVVGYADKDAVPMLENKLGTVLTLDRKYQGWERAEYFGTRGQSFTTKLPTRLNADDGITFDQTDPADGSFSERILAVTADQLKNSRYAYTNVEEAVYDVDGLLNTNPQSAVNEIANAMDRFAATSVSLRGYRAFGDFAVQSGQMQTVGEVTDAVATFQSFGCGSRGYYLIPFRAAAKITQSGLQQFVMKRNEDIAVKGEIGELNGVPDTTFLSTNLLPIHISGTAANNVANLGTGFTIDSVVVTPPSNLITGNQAGITTINLTGMTDGETILVDDIIDIGFLNVSNPLIYLTFTGYNESEQSIQGRVIVGGTVVANALQIQIEPALIFDATEINVNRNLNRAIIPGTDTLRVARSHRAAGLYIGEYGKFVNPQLPEKDTYKSASIKSKDTQLSMRVYHGDTRLGADAKYMVHDVLYGFGGAAEGFGRILYPIIT